MKIAYLASQKTLPRSLDRRVEAVEHDQMMFALQSAFEPQTSTIDDIAWDDHSVDWSSFDAALIGSTWDYCDRYQEFLNVLNKISLATAVFNSPAQVEWNGHKSYLRELEHKGIQVIPTIWLDGPANGSEWSKMFETFSAQKLVIKRQIGANAEGQILLQQGDMEGDKPPTISNPVMVQPFLVAVATEGEYSFIFIDGELSHALIKRPAPGDYRIQSAYGGTEAAISPDQQDLNIARSVLETLDELPLYARVDMLRASNGKLELMELELIEPFLYPLQGKDLGNHIYQALKKRL